MARAVTFTTPDEPGRKYTATIYQAGKALDKEKTRRAYAGSKTREQGCFRGCMSMPRSRPATGPVIAVPEEAVVSSTQQVTYSVYKGKRMENGKEISDFEAVEVKKGATDGGFTEITLPENYPAVGTAGGDERGLFRALCVEECR